MTARGRTALKTGRTMAGFIPVTSFCMPVLRKRAILAGRNVELSGPFNLTPRAIVLLWSYDNPGLLLLYCLVPPLGTRSSRGNRYLLYQGLWESFSCLSVQPRLVHLVEGHWLMSHVLQLLLDLQCGKSLRILCCGWWSQLSAGSWCREWQKRTTRTCRVEDLMREDLVPGLCEGPWGWRRPQFWPRSRRHLELLRRMRQHMLGRLDVAMLWQ